MRKNTRDEDLRRIERSVLADISDPQALERLVHQRVRLSGESEIDVRAAFMRQLPLGEVRNIMGQALGVALQKSGYRIQQTPDAYGEFIQHSHPTTVEWTYRKKPRTSLAIVDWGLIRGPGSHILFDSNFFFNPTYSGAHRRRLSANPEQAYLNGLTARHGWVDAVSILSPDYGFLIRWFRSGTTSIGRQGDYVLFMGLPTWYFHIGVRSLKNLKSEGKRGVIWNSFYAHMRLGVIPGEPTDMDYWLSIPDTDVLSVLNDRVPKIGNAFLADLYLVDMLRPQGAS